MLSKENVGRKNTQSTLYSSSVSKDFKSFSRFFFFSFSFSLGRLLAFACPRVMLDVVKFHNAGAHVRQRQSFCWVIIKSVCLSDIWRIRKNNHHSRECPMASRMSHKSYSLNLVVTSQIWKDTAASEWISEEVILCVHMTIVAWSIVSWLHHEFCCCRVVDMLFAFELDHWCVSFIVTIIDKISSDFNERTKMNRNNLSNWRERERMSMLSTLTISALGSCRRRRLY